MSMYEFNIDSKLMFDSAGVRGVGAGGGGGRHRRGQGRQHDLRLLKVRE